MFSKSCKYGIRAVIYLLLLSEKNQRASIKEISKAIESPEAFTGKILQQLVKSNIIHSVKGNTGGFEINRLNFESKKLIEVVYAIDGGDAFKECVIGLKKCSEEQPCPLHHNYKSIKKEMLQMLHSTSIPELISGIQKGEQFLKINNLNIHNVIFSS
jgi:Rrf2 family protein